MTLEVGGTRGGTSEKELVRLSKTTWKGMEVLTVSRRRRRKIRGNWLTSFTWKMAI